MGRTKNIPRFAGIRRERKTRREKEGPVGTVSGTDTPLSTGERYTSSQQQGRKDRVDQKTAFSLSIQQDIGRLTISNPRIDTPLSTGERYTLS